jgi:hypothetical protein
MILNNDKERQMIQKPHPEKSGKPSRDHLSFSLKLHEKSFLTVKEG